MPLYFDLHALLHYIGHHHVHGGEMGPFLCCLFLGSSIMPTATGDRGIDHTPAAHIGVSQVSPL